MLLTLLLVGRVSTSVAQVQSRGDVSFAVPPGWTHQSNARSDVLSFRNGAEVWLIVIYPAAACTGDPAADMRAAWARTLAETKMFPPAPSSSISEVYHVLGYPARATEGPDLGRASYARLYVLNAGSRCVPVVALAANAYALQASELMVNVILSSIRLAPLHAEPLKTAFAVSDLAGEWSTNSSSATAIYSAATGNYVGSQIMGSGATYWIAADGHYTYRDSVMVNSVVTKSEDAGQVSIDGDRVTFKGDKFTSTYRLVFAQQALDGSTVLTLFSATGEMTPLSVATFGEHWVRPPAPAR